MFNSRYIVVSLSAVILSTLSMTAAEATVSKRTKTATRAPIVGEAMRPRKSLSFEGRNVEALKPGTYDSVSHLSDGSRGKKAQHLYGLPADFSNRAAADQAELRYRP